MTRAYSQLKRVLDAQRMTIPELHKRIAQSGVRINLKSLYRLSKEHQPVERLDMRVAGAICQVCRVPLSELIAFEAPQRRLQRFSGTIQKRLDMLMDKNNEGQLTVAETEELRTLVQRAEEITLANARLLARQRRHLATR